jgi:hypothetical protein
VTLGHLPDRPALDDHGIHHITSPIHADTSLGRCPRCLATCCPLCDGTEHCRGRNFRERKSSGCSP